jgi:hypothetical protein
VDDRAHFPAIGQGYELVRHRGFSCRRTIGCCIADRKRDAESLERPQDEPNFRARLSALDLDEPFAAGSRLLGKGDLIEPKLDPPLPDQGPQIG